MNEDTDAGQSDELPELPEPKSYEGGYSDDQMMGYARAAIKASQACICADDAGHHTGHCPVFKNMKTPATTKGG